ncbi:MAG: polyprenyl synthetase family protein, partial [Candidatus Marinimicrobia bacterium]|nr:polyprenyl synthetase family protein [Candidatus Neomarinimicrobiota bacterium]
MSAAYPPPLARAMRAVLQDLNAVAPRQAALPSLVRAFCLRPGKLLRPRLLRAAHAAAGGRGTPPALWQLAAALELTHSFALIHDDLVDQAQVRRGGRALPGLLDEAYPGQGRELALITGDWLYTAALRLAFTATRALPNSDPLFNLWLAGAQATAAGELGELLASAPCPLPSVRRILALYDQKTGQYTFVLPLVMGVLSAGGGEYDLKAIEAAGLCLGRAFQIRNDLADFRSGRDEDIRQGRPTLLAARLLAAAKPRERP